MTAAVNLPAEWQLKQLAQRYLETVPHQIGETVQIGWFIFRVASASVPPELESLDFRKMASFTVDFSEAERIRVLQTEALERFQVDAEGCTLLQTALVSRSYSPLRSDAFIERQTPNGENDSGWYVGVLKEKKDMDDEGSFDVRSLYELSITDQRMLPFWLLPTGMKLILSTGQRL